MFSEGLNRSVITKLLFRRAKRGRNSGNSGRNSGRNSRKITHIFTYKIGK
jgi:hypothetical protein